MISLLHEQFYDVIASKIMSFMEHPTAKMMKDHFEYMEMLKFDPRHDWSEWQTLYGLAHVGRHDRHYLTYGGGPEGGIVKGYRDGWYIWHRDWGTGATYTRIPEELEIIYKNDDGYEAIKLVMSKHNYEVADNEHYLDDIETEMDWIYTIEDRETEDDESEDDDSEEDESDVEYVYIYICF